MQKEKIFAIPIDNISMAEALEMAKDMLENMEAIESLQFYEYLSSTKGLTPEGKDSKTRPKND